MQFSLRAARRVAQIGLLLLAASAAAQTSSELFARASQAFERGNYAAALDDFEAARAAGMTGAAIDYNIAVCRYRLGRWAAAEADFALLAVTYPRMQALADYNRALALTRLGREDAAHEALTRARRGGDEQVAALADALLARLDARDEDADTAAARSSIKYLDLGLGHDDNVALVDEASLPATSSTDSPFAELYGQLGIPLGDGPWRVEASGYAASYADAGEFDQTVLQAGATRAWRHGAWRLDAGPYLSRSTLDGDEFEQRFGARVGARRRLDAASAVLLELGREAIDAGEARFDFVDGNRTVLRARYERRAAGGRWRADFDREHNDRASAGVSPTRTRLRVSYRRSLTEIWIAELGFAHRISDYDDLTAPRDETLDVLAASAGRDFGDRWQGWLRYELSNNDSDDTRYEYRRHRLTVSFGRLF